MAEECTSAEHERMHTIEVIEQRPAFWAAESIDDATSRAPSPSPAAVANEHLAVVHRTGLVDQRGSRNPYAKLTDAQVAEIRARRANGEELIPIAADFGISIGHVSAIALGKTRKAGGVIGLPYLDGVQHAAMPGGAT